MKTPKAVSQSLALSVKYASVLPPFDTGQFLRAVAEAGFFLPEPIGPVLPGQRLETRGTVARKAEISIRFDSERQILGVNAPDVDTLIKEMTSTESLLKSEFDFDSPSWAHYYEFLASLTVRAKSNPLKSWYTHFAQVPIMMEFSEVLGTEVCPFGIKLAAKEQGPNQPDWFDIHIQPLFQSPANRHMVEIVFRRSRREEVFAFVQGVEGTVSRLLSLIEKV